MAHWIAQNETVPPFINGRVPTLTYVLDEPHERAVRLLRSALRQHGLQVIAEMDIGDMIQS